MPRRKTQLRSGTCYHVYNRGVNRQPIFFEQDNYTLFLACLRNHLTPDNVEVLAYCLMPNHFHLLVRLATDSFSNLVKSATATYVTRINGRYNRVGPLFQGRFKAKIVDSDKYLLHLSRYLHLNPVRAGLVRSAQAWKHSSYPTYIGLQENSLCDPNFVLSLLTLGTAKPDERRSAYQEFVESYQESEQPKIAHLRF